MLSGSSYIPPFYFYQFADAISAPYTSLKAYQSGIIDANGNILKPESSLDPFEYLVIKLKQIFEQLPYGMTKAKLGGYLSTLQLFAEEAEEYNFNSEYMHALIEGHIFQMTNGEVSYLELCEDMGVGGGGAGSLGTPMPGSGDNVGVAGFDPPLSDKIIKRKYLQNCEIFEVCPEEYAMFKNAKNWKNIPEGPTKNYLQRFQRRNKDAKIAVRTTLPESGEQDLYWITYPAKSFMEEYGLENVDFLIEDVKTTKQGYHAGNVLERLISNIGTQEDYDISKLNRDQTEYVGRMVDWVNGFHAASTSGEEGHAEQWIDLGFKNALKKSSQNDSKGPIADPDGFRYDPTSKSTNFQDRIVKVDYGTDRKPVGELSRKRQGIELQGETIALPTEKSEFKKTVRELIQSPEIERRMRSEMETQIQTPQTIAHKTFTATKKLLPARGFVSHPIEQLKQTVQSRLFGINPAVGAKTENEPHGRQTVKSLDLRVRSKSSPSVGGDVGYDEIRSIPGGDEPKEAISVSLDAIDHLFDQIPDGYVGQNGVNKDTLRQQASKILAPHIKRGRYPLELPSSKTISA